MVESFEYMDALRALMLTSLTMFPFPHSICLPYQLLTPVPLLVLHATSKGDEEWTSCESIRATVEVGYKETKQYGGV